MFDTLENAKIAIDKENLSYYTFNTKDCNEMKDKLSQRELELLSQMARAIVYPNEQVATLDETLVGINVTPSFDVDLENFIIGSNHEVSNER